jgi:hypothetical protein
MPQNEYIEQAVKRHGHRLDHDEKRWGHDMPCIVSRSQTLTPSGGSKSLAARDQEYILLARLCRICETCQVYKSFIFRRKKLSREPHARAVYIKKLHGLK